MFFTGMWGHHKQTAMGWKDKKPRPLGEAAQLARLEAKAEQLAISAQDCADDGWYAQSILETVPVYGTRATLPEAIAAAERQGLDFNPTTQSLNAGGARIWRDVHVRREDFAHYLDWLRSVW